MAKVVVVEDDALTGRLVREVIASLGHVVVTVSTADAAREAVDAATGVALVDLRLGTESGLDLIAWFAKDAAVAHVPVVAMTADDQPETLAALENLGVGFLLPKPFGADEVAMLVEAALEAGPKNKRPPDGGL